MTLALSLFFGPFYGTLAEGVFQELGFMFLAASDMGIQRVAVAVAKQMDFGRQSTPRAA